MATKSFEKGMAKVKAAGMKGSMENALKKIDIRQKLNESLAKLGAEGISAEGQHAA